jgi:hypothetical protein
MTEGRSRRTQESATSLAVMTTPLCDESMQKEKKEKEKEKRKKISMDYLIISHLVVYRDDVGKYISVTT